jgi:hypothetical protein
MIMDSVNLSVIKITFVTDSLNYKVYLTGQAISKLQIPMTKTFRNEIPSRDKTKLGPEFFNFFRIPANSFLKHFPRR